MNGFIENYSIEKRVYHRRGRNAGFNTRVVRYIVVRPLMALGPRVLTDARGNARRFETREAAEAAGKAWIATLQVAA